MIKTNTSGFRVAVGQELDKYSQEVAVACKACVDETMDSMVDELKGVRSSRFAGKYTRPWKKFPRAWTSKSKQVTSGRVEGVVYLKAPKYRIGHLLENEHKSRDGGVTQGSHFIEKIADKWEKLYQERMMEMIGKVV